MTELTDEQILELAGKHLQYDRTVDTLAFARALLSASKPAVELTDETRSHLKDAAAIIHKYHPSVSYAARAIEQLLAASPAAPAQSAEVNQCDGCRVKAPLTERGIHRYSDGSLIGCTKDRYAASQPSQTSVALGDERAAFEAWWVRDIPAEYREMSIGMIRKDMDREGISYLKGAWHAWQARAESMQPVAQPVEQTSGDTGNPEADRIIGRLSSSDPEFDDCADAVAFIRKLVVEHKGPDGFPTWKDAAIAERMRRVNLEDAAHRYQSCRESAIERGLFATPDEYDEMVDSSLRKNGKEPLTGRGHNYGKKVAKDGSLYRPQPVEQTRALTDERPSFEAAWRQEYPMHGETTFKRSGFNPDAYVNTRVQDGWLMWKARAKTGDKSSAARPASGETE